MNSKQNEQKPPSASTAQNNAAAGTTTTSSSSSASPGLSVGHSLLSSPANSRRVQSASSASGGTISSTTEQMGQTTVMQHSRVGMDSSGSSARQQILKPIVVASQKDRRDKTKSDKPTSSSVYASHVLPSVAATHTEQQAKSISASREQVTANHQLARTKTPVVVAPRPTSLAPQHKLVVPVGVQATALTVPDSEHGKTSTPTASSLVQGEQISRRSTTVGIANAPQRVKQPTTKTIAGGVWRGSTTGSSKTKIHAEEESDDEDDEEYEEGDDNSESERLVVSLIDIHTGMIVAEAANAQMLAARVADIDVNQILHSVEERALLMEKYLVEYSEGYTYKDDPSLFPTTTTTKTRKKTTATTTTQDTALVQQQQKAAPAQQHRKQLSAQQQALKSASQPLAPRFPPQKTIPTVNDKPVALVHPQSHHGIPVVAAAAVGSPQLAQQGTVAVDRDQKVVPRRRYVKGGNARPTRYQTSPSVVALTTPLPHYPSQQIHDTLPPPQPLRTIGFDLSTLKPLRRRNNRGIRPKKLIELHSLITDEVLCCFRGTTHASRALQVTRDQVNGAVRETGGAIFPERGGFRLKAAPAHHDNPRAYEYGAHEVDYEETNETHEELLKRFRQTFHGEIAGRIGPEILFDDQGIRLQSGSRKRKTRPPARYTNNASTVITTTTTSTTAASGSPYAAGEDEAYEDPDDQEYHPPGTYEASSVNRSRTSARIASMSARAPPPLPQSTESVDGMVIGVVNKSNRNADVGRRHLPQDSRNDRYDLQCIFCQEKKVEITFEPCLHTILCTDCATVACKMYCPLCRTPINDKIKAKRQTLIRPRIYSAYSFM